MSYWDQIDDDTIALRAQAVSLSEFGQNMADGSKKVASAMEEGAAASSGTFVPAMCDVDTSRQGATGMHVGQASDTTDGMHTAAGIIVDHDSEASRVSQGSATYGLLARM
ncbi:hypothetical protein [Amycolatopsis alba]|uniref:Uncharacterized protein n=1 Tax=Amycolatopsis alba DSM 44262 TaxID=1125972 RepID=A0A229RG41_AMYAL|nr:hypothetical protein [Amycolatopsis alba]OXM45626.1 hypothetical protein CFP75_30315 [Amycolatopsis alba DSM 44262]